MKEIEESRAVTLPRETTSNEMYEAEDEPEELYDTIENEILEVSLDKRKSTLYSRLNTSYFKGDHHDMYTLVYFNDWNLYFNCLTFQILGDLQAEVNPAIIPEAQNDRDMWKSELKREAKHVKITYHQNRSWHLEGSLDDMQKAESCLQSLYDSEGLYDIEQANENLQVIIQHC